MSYLDKPVSRGKLVAIVAALIVQMVLSFALMPVDDFPLPVAVQVSPVRGAGVVTGHFTGYSRTAVIVSPASCIPLTGLAFPIIEELYFRGFLLPRLFRLGRWARVVNAALFSLYHFWAPWGFLSRLIFMLPGVWLVRRKNDLWLSI